ncbi:protein mono-ADP-ribosyltransferase PARP4 [Polymixia lowei]
MALFENCSVLLELKDLPFKEKKRLKLAVTENGGSISYVVNKQCSLIVTSDLSTLSCNRLRSLQKHSTPVVGVDYVYRCLERGHLLPLEEHRLSVSPPSLSSSSPPFLRRSSQKPGPLSQQVSKVTTGKPVVKQSKDPPQTVSAVRQAGGRRQEGNYTFLGKFRVHTENDNDLPKYPDDFEVAKYSIFEKVTSRSWCVLELQSSIAEEGQRYRVVRYRKDDTGAKSVVVRDKLVFLSTSEEAMEVYQALRKELQVKGHTLRNNLPSQVQDMGSAALKQLLLEEKLNTGSLSQEVGVFVELLWTEALGCLGNILKVPITSLSLNDVSRTEGLLLQAQKKLREARHAEVASLMEQVYTLLPHREPCPPANAKLISQKLDLCQLIRDVLNVSEVTLRSPSPSCLGKYRALRCSVERLPPDTPEFQSVTDLLQDREVQVQQVLRVSRGAELQMFKKELGNVKPLLHSSRPSSFVGILSRGLLLPRAGVEHHGIERTDIGYLGSGIYFTDSMSASLRYSAPGVTDGSRLLLVCDVALGRCRDVQKKDPGLTQAPQGYHSVHGVRHTPTAHSEFQDDEFVVYRPEQVKLKYVVQFSVEDDQLKDFHPSIDTSSELPKPTSDQVLSIEEDGVGSSKNPLDGVTAGLLDSSGQQLPLQAVHVKCKLMDLLSQVIIFQKYTNQSSVPIEAKYVFPLGDSATVCGFEAFINGKHVVGQVKEKEQARTEYKQALERGHGAYLMDQDAPDVFTISVGNLPPGATVLIKVTFVSELIVRDGCVFFSLPGSVAPWQQSAALNQTTQTTLEKVCVTDLAARTGEFTLDLSAEMPCEITSLHCISHQVRVKKTDCKAVVSVLAGEVMGPDGFQLSITLSHIHLPRMWVENHPDKDSQACMLVFYSEFDLGSRSALNELVLLLDTSESMRGDALQNARRIALEVLKTLDRNLRVNVVFFGTDHTEAFLEARPLMEALQPAKKFIMSSPPVGGSTELWRPLRGLSLLPPSHGLRNLLLLSDGHIQNPSLTLQLVRDNAKHSRLFTCGLSPTANRHMLRALAQAGGGTYEFFDTKTKHNWSEKVVSQVKRMASPGCSSVSVKWQQFNPTASLPVQAPSQLHALFNDCHTLVYGFVPHCTQATLLGNLSGREIKTMVSTSELQKTRGTFLHKLTARAIIRDYEDGSLDTNEAEHEGKKAELKSFIIELSKEFSILSQFTSFVAIEERDGGQSEPEQFTDIPKLIAEEDVDFLPYMSWMEEEELVEVELDEEALCDEPIEGDMELMVDFGHLPSSSYIPHTAQRGGEIERRRRFMGGRGERAVYQSAVRDSEIRVPRPFDDLLDLEQILSFGQRTCSPKHVQYVLAPPPDLLQTDDRLMTPASCGTIMAHAQAAPLVLSSSSLFSSPCPPPPPVPQKYGSARGVRHAPPPPPPVPQKYGVPYSAVMAKPDQSEVLRRQKSAGDWSFRRSGRYKDSSVTPDSSAMDLVALQILSQAASSQGLDKNTGEEEVQMEVCSLVMDRGEKQQKWIKIFQMQHSDGYWECTAELGTLMKVDIDSFTNGFLKNKGICSLGVRAHADILRLVASLLVLQLMRLDGLDEGKLLRTLFSLDEPQPRCERWEALKKAVGWVCWADRQYPCIYSRLEFGWSWESSTRQLLGYERPPALSPLSGATPWRTGTPLEVQ